MDRDRVGLHDGEGVWIAAREFERLAEAEAPEQALALSRGELLEGIVDEWALSARERHRERVVALLELLAQEHEQRGERLEALDLTRRQVERYPFDEQAHRRLIVGLDALGDRAGGLRAYCLLAERLRRFPMAQLPDTQRDHQRVTVSCLVSDLRFEWRLEPARDGTLITVDVEIPDTEAQRLDRQRGIIRASLEGLATLAATPP